MGLLIFDIINLEVFKLNTEELERKLRDSTASYPFKTSRLVHGIFRMPCPDCSFTNDDPPIPFFLKNEKCFQRCPFNVITWILNAEQTVLYEKFRPDKKKKNDLEMSINAHKVAVIQETTRRDEQTVASPYFFNKVKK